MTRTEALKIITSRLSSADDERLEMVASMLEDWPDPSIYERLPESEKEKIERALDRLDRGQSVPSDEVFALLESKIKTAGA